MGNIIKSIIDIARKLFIDERIIDYRSNFTRYQDIITQIFFETNKIIVTFSLAALAAMAALNEHLFLYNKLLSFITLTCFIVVIIFVLVGLFISRGMLIDAQKIVSKNFKKSVLTPLSSGLDKVKFSKSSKIVSNICLSLFITGMVLFLVLMALYITGIK